MAFWVEERVGDETLPRRWYRKMRGKSIEWWTVSNKGLQGRARSWTTGADHAEEAVRKKLQIQHLLPSGLEWHFLNFYSWSLSAREIKNITFIYLLSVCACAHGHVLVEVRGQLSGVGSVLPPCGSWTLFQVVILGRTSLLINLLDFARENFLRPWTFMYKIKCLLEL